VICQVADKWHGTQNLNSEGCAYHRSNSKIMNTHPRRKNKMNTIKLTDISIKQLETDEKIPYALLLDADPSRELIEKYLKSSEIYVARLGNEIIGVYVLCPITSEKAEIKNIAVEEKFQGKGVGKLLLEDTFKLAKAKGYKELIIGTGNSSVGQLYLYQKVGFEMSKIKWNFFIDNYPDPLYEKGIQVKHMIVLSRLLL